MKIRDFRILIGLEPNVLSINGKYPNVHIYQGAIFWQPQQKKKSNWIYCDLRACAGWAVFR